MTTTPAAIDVGQVVDAFCAGELGLIVDDIRDMGMLCIPASLASAARINDLTTMARGLVYVALETDRLDRLAIPRVGASATGPANIHVPVDSRHDTTTGISAGDRAATIERLLAADASHQDFRLSGHLTPVALDKDGILGRPRVPEAASFLSERAGTGSVVAFAAVLTNDGALARGDQIAALSDEFGIPYLRVSDVLRLARNSTPFNGAPIVPDLSSFHLDTSVLIEPNMLQSPVNISALAVCPTGTVRRHCSCAMDIASAVDHFDAKREIVLLVWSRMSLRATCAKEALAPMLPGVARIVAANLETTLADT